MTYAQTHAHVPPPKVPPPPMRGPQPPLVIGLPAAGRDVVFVERPVMVLSQDTHSKVVGYVLWLIGFTGAHRFYYGKPITGLIWLFTFGLLGIGWIIDAFLIPAMDNEASYRFAPGPTDYNLAWVTLLLFGWLGIHRFVQGKWVTGVIYLLTFGVLGLGIVYDILTLNFQIDETHRRKLRRGY